MADLLMQTAQKTYAMVNYEHISMTKLGDIELQVNPARTTHVLIVRAFAAAAGCSRPSVHEVEPGKRVARLDTIRRLSAAPGMEPTQIVEFRRALLLPKEDLR